MHLCFDVAILLLGAYSDDQQKYKKDKSTRCNSKTLEKTKMYINKGLDKKKSMVYVYKLILCSCKKKREHIISYYIYSSGSGSHKGLILFPRGSLAMFRLVELSQLCREVLLESIG